MLTSRLLKVYMITTENLTRISNQLFCKLRIHPLVSFSMVEKSKAVLAADDQIKFKEPNIIIECKVHLD